jgi:hypothetical protein
MLRGWFDRADTVRLLARSVRDSDSRAADNRKHGRLWLGGQVECSLGRILDISRGGARVLSKERVEGEGLIRIKVTGGVLVVQSRVVWCRKRGFRKWELGLEFYGITDEVSTILAQLATS